MDTNSIYKNAIQLTRDLIKIPSESSDPLATEGPPEARISTFLSKICAENQLDFFLQEAIPQRYNLIISLPKENVPKILFLAHMDTVSAKNMTHPFMADYTGEVISGRGACDDKGPLATLLATLIGIKNKRDRQNFDITLACTVDEENSMSGAAVFARGNPQKYDICMALEPSLLQPISKHKGAYRCRILPNFKGDFSPRKESSRSREKLLEGIIADLTTFKNETQKQADPQLGQADITITEIKGEPSANKVADLHRILVDIRMLPSQSPAKIHADISSLISTRGKVVPLFAGLGIDSAPENHFIQKFQQSLKKEGFSDKLIALPFPSDCSQLRGQSTCLVWGPGNPKHAHKHDEQIKVSQIKGACRVLTDFLISS